VASEPVSPAQPAQQPTRSDRKITPPPWGARTTHDHATRYSAENALPFDDRLSPPSTCGAWFCRRGAGCFVRQESTVDSRGKGTDPMDEMNERIQAAAPEDLGRFFIERANSGDVEGLVALYEGGAVLALSDGGTASGVGAIRQFYEQLLANKPTFASGIPRPALRNGDWALTSTRIPAGATTELAHRQPNGTWLWTIDQPNVLGD